MGSGASAVQVNRAPTARKRPAFSRQLPARGPLLLEAAGDWRL